MSLDRTSSMGFEGTSKMSVDGSSKMMAQLAELRINRDDADVTLNCQGEVIMAHSLILRTRCLQKPFIL